MITIFGRKNGKNMDDEISELCRAVKESTYTVAVTGAGISISAGGCSFAGMTTRRAWDMMSNDPEKMYRAMYDVFLRPTFEHGPTPAHKALARLEEMGKLQGIITTNEDCIHTVAGSKNVAELEGSYQVNTCRSCGYRNFDLDIWNHGHMPTCPKCGDIMLSYDIYSHISLWPPAVENARKWISDADLILVIGTSGYYGSAYWDRRKRDATIIQINPGRTNFDSVAYLNIRQDADTVFEKLMSMMEADRYAGDGK